jgi:hypothetical protein
LRQAYDYWQDQPGNYPIHDEMNPKTQTKSWLKTE